MRSVVGLACVLLSWGGSSAAPMKALAKQPPESLLPADTVLYLRYDGYEPHRKAYEQTALGRAMRDDLGEFIDYVGVFVTETITNSFSDKNPEDMRKLAGGWRKFANYLWQHGLIVGVQVSGPSGANPAGTFGVRTRLTVVFPDGGITKNRHALTPILQVLGGNKKKQVGPRTLYENDNSGVYGAWWQEGRHLVFVGDDTNLDGIFDVAEGRRSNLEGNPLFKNVAGFTDYETDIRGFLDVRRLVALLRTPSDSGSKLAMAGEWMTRSFLLSQLGLTSCTSASVHLGFDRQYQRSTIVLNVAEREQRAGLARLVFAPVEFSTRNLPALPPDAASVRVSQVDWKVVYDFARRFAGLYSLTGLFGEGGLKGVLGGSTLGMDIHKDVLAHLDSTLVLYNSLSEGPFFLGQGIAIKVKEEKKLAAGLDKLVRGLIKLSGADMAVKKQTYRGVDLCEVTLPIPVPAAPTYAIHNGWLLIGVFPQPVKGCILRSSGRYRVWQPPPLTAEALVLARKKAGPNSRLAAVTVTDPRPAMTAGLSLLPVMARSIGLASGTNFDVNKIPSAQALTEWQFPGVTVFYDDGNALRWESHSSIELPGDWLILGYSLAGLAGSLF